MNTAISRGLKITFLLHGIEGFFTGVILLLIPTIFGDLVNWDMSDVAYRIVGAAVLGCALSSLLSYYAALWRDVKIVVEAKVAWMSLAAIVILWGLLAGNIPDFGWLFFVVMAAFAIAFGYFLVIYSRVEES
ncbi:MAG TPA: hypothetical protein VFI27_12945 [candidate division Zixibacteria bacterium]|nr:hypothetical protein [candidate division Zixibacteria bacterium]